ncbi:hypothetical protein BDR05DRAFT_949748 [Suillus weaverae]|nr:hypothetical protein BDR05DRAFT_949748 [Suillus weaverae]
MPSCNTKHCAEDDLSPSICLKLSRINLEHIKEESVTTPKDEHHSITVWHSKIMDEAVSQTELQESVEQLQWIIDNLQQDHETTCTKHEAEVQWYREHMEHLEKTIASQSNHIEELESDIIYHQVILNIKQNNIDHLEADIETKQKETEEIMECQNALAIVRRGCLSEIQDIDSGIHHILSKHLQ